MLTAFHSRSLASRPAPNHAGRIVSLTAELPSQYLCSLRYRKGDAFGDEIRMGIAAYVRDIARVEETASDIRDLLIRRLGHENFMITADRQIFGAYRDSVRTRVTVLVGIAVPALLAGAAVTMALMLGAIRQRAREIAIRKAVGARRSDISRQFIAETCLITALGIALGVPLGFLAGYVVELGLDAPSAYESWYVWAAAGVPRWLRPLRQASCRHVARHGSIRRPRLRLSELT